MRSSLITVAVAALAWLAISSTEAVAQSDAEIALEKARTAFANEQFESARDLLVTASQTDAANPDIFLLLGKAHYQLGEIDQAVSAWKRMLKLAPTHAYAKRMVDTLQGKILDVDVRIKVIESLLQQRLPQLAQPEILAIKRGSLSAVQLAQLLSLEAEMLIDLGQAAGALKPLNELAIRDPAQAATAPIRLLTAKAKLAAGGDSVAEALVMLAAIKNEFADTPEATGAELALISHRIEQNEVALEELVTWINANPQHDDLQLARQTMIHAVTIFMQVASKQPMPKQDEPLSAADESTLTAAEHALVALKNAKDSLTLSTQLANFINSRWVAGGAFATANTALERLLKLQLPASSRVVLENALTQSTHAAAARDLDEILVALQEGDETAATLVTWIEANDDHPRLLQARMRLVSSLLEATRRGGIPKPGAQLSESDKAAISLAAGILDSLKTTKEKTTMIQGLLDHLKKHYSAHGANAAAITGQQSILAAKLLRQSRRAVLSNLADTQTELALTRLTAEASSGTLAAGPLPADLVELLKTFQTINTEYPDQPSWAQQASVGQRIFALSQQVNWPAKVTAIKMTDDWALEFVLPVVVANHDAKTTEAAVAVVRSIVECVAAVNQKSARGLATQTHQRLLDALPGDHALWPATVMRQLTLRVSDDTVAFQENIASAQGHLNAELSDDAKALLELASTLIASHPSKATEVLATLQPFLSLRSAAGFDTAVQAAYVILEESLPPQQRGAVRLAIAQSWINQVIADHNRLLSNGFQPPKQLDEQLQQALVRCYELQADLAPDHPQVQSIQAVRSTVIAHYRNLQYYDATIAAITVKGEQPVEWLDARADFELASLKLSIALDDVADQTRQFQGRQNVTLTPAVKEAIAGLETFVTDRPTDPRVPQVVAKILSVGKTYEKYEKFDIAAEVYAGLETFALANESLQHSQPGTPDVALRAAHAVALAMHVKATKALSESIKAQPDGADPPSELSDEFQAAITSYQAIITKYADGPLVSSAIGKLMEIALQYANVGAWDVAESVYADLAQQQLPLRQPERLDLARALCELGKVIPDHARQVLAAITLWERSTPSPQDAVSQIASAAVPGSSAGPSGGIGGGAGFGDESDLQLEGGAKLPGAAAPAVDTAVVGDFAANQPLPTAPLPVDPFGTAADMPMGNAAAGKFRADLERAARQTDLLAAVRRQQSAMASQVAMLRDKEIRQIDVTKVDEKTAQQQAPLAQVPVLSEAEILRRATILDSAYEKLQAIRKTYVESATAGQAREQILVIVNHWRSIAQWERSAKLVRRFLDDNPTDIALPSLRHEIARDLLAWAAGAVKPDTPKQELLDEVNKRFSLAREELAGIIAAFPDNQALVHQAQWDVAGSHLSQARVVAGFSSTLARGQFVRAANELLATADLYHDHPQINELPQMLWNIAQELTNRRFYDEAITVWNEMTLHYPGDPLAQQAALQIAQTYQNQLRLPLRAVESYLELNFSRGGNDTALQDAIFQIASQLMQEKRWVESLHVLETFVDSFPTHASAGQALTMIGQVHQTNEVWEDAIAAYRRVILEYGQGNWTQQSKWSIAECTINLSRWEEAQGAYREYQKAYPEDPKIAEATARLEILKDLARFQKVVDEEGQRKAFDAQYQIAAIVRTKLANRVKAIIEYKKVAERWPESHLADDALFQVGMIYMELGRTGDARDAFLATAEQYPTSPLADDALFQVGATFENEAQSLAGVTRGEANKIAMEEAQRQAYGISQDNRRFRRAQSLEQIAQTKKGGNREELDKQTAFQAALSVQFDQANASVVANWAAQKEEALTTAQLADRQDKINAALRSAVTNFRRAAKVASADKADDALLRMAQIYDQRLKDSDAAMATWLEIVKQYSGTTVAEDASWKIAQYYETHEKYADAISAYNSFLRNYRRSPKASSAQAAIAENHEQLGNWVEAMDAYTNYINNYPEGNMAGKAKEQIAWIKTYRL